MVVVGRRHLQGLGLKLQLQLGSLGLGRRLMLAGDQRPTRALHHGLLAAQRVLLLRVRVHFMVLVGMRVDLVVLLMLMGVHFRVLLMGLVGVHLVVLLVRPV